LWSGLRRKQIQGRTFTRQRPIGPYIVDFHCASASLVVELDGGQHYADEGRKKDRQRDRDLAALGLRVLRFSDHDVLANTESVLQAVWEACDMASKPPRSPFAKGG
jgi:very-short-patch-repair endonuclease